MKGLGDRLSRLEPLGESYQSPTGPPPPRAGQPQVTFGASAAARPIPAGCAPSPPPQVVACAPQGASQLLGRGLLSPRATLHPQASGAASRPELSDCACLCTAAAWCEADAPTGGGAFGADMPATRGREKGSGRALREMLEQQGVGDGNTQLLVQAAMLEALEGIAQGRVAKEPETLEDLLFGTLGREDEDAGKLGSMAKGISKSDSLARRCGEKSGHVHRVL
eukprot:5028837-Amphidinium_carterae.2